MNPIQWVKNNKLATVLILIVLYLVFSRNSINHPMFLMKSAGNETYGYAETDSVSIGRMGMGVGALPPTDYYEESVSPGSYDRKVVTENYLSLQVSDVPKTIAQIKAKAEALKGFMVNSSLSKPEEAASGSITIRVPTANSDEMIASLKASAMKVVSEDITGYDITDQYKDVDSRLMTLQENKARFETIMDEADTVEEILKVQQHIFSLQDQIDSLIGQRDYLKNTSQTVKITVYLSTDELALPYVPDNSWRPAAIYREAVRALVLDMRSLINTIIWLAVYALVWIPLILIGIIVYRWWKKRSKASAKKK